MKLDLFESGWPALYLARFSGDIMVLLLRNPIVKFGVILRGPGCGVRMENTPRVVEGINMISGYNLHLVASCDSLMCSSSDMDRYMYTAFNLQPIIFHS